MDTLFNMSGPRGPEGYIYVIADKTTGRGSPAQPRAPILPNPYPPVTGPLPSLVQADEAGATWVFAGSFAGRCAAMHFVGALEAANPGLKASSLAGLGWWVYTPEGPGTGL